MDDDLQDDAWADMDRFVMRLAAQWMAFGVAVGAVLGAGATFGLFLVFKP